MLKQLKEYADYASEVIYDNENYEMDLQFYLTNSCNLNCPGCYLSETLCKTDKSWNVLPLSDLGFYLEEFENIPAFTKNVVFTGGEIFTLPINGLEWAAHCVLDRGWGLQLKTNAKWVIDDSLCKSVMNMLRRLNPDRGLVATEQQIKRFLHGKPKFLLRLLGPEVVRKWMFKVLPTTSLLSMALSVDDKLHPVQSADWFVKIINQVSGDKSLREKVALKSFTLSDSMLLFEQKVLNNPQLKVKNFSEMQKLMGVKYSVNGTKIESYFGDFVDLTKVSAKEKLSNFVQPPLGAARGRLVYSFYPDRIVGLDSYYLQSVGRVSTLNTDGSLKSFNKIRRDITTQLVLDYGREIQK